MLQHFLSDSRVALRIVTKAPVFFLTVVVILALGIGANTAIFTVVNTVLLHPMPYPHSERIVNISRQAAGGTNSVPMFNYWMDNNPGFEDLAGYQASMTANLIGTDKPELVDAMKASQNYFKLFGANPILGRTFTSEEDRSGGAHVFMMSYGLWQRRFGGDPSILGKAVTIGGVPYEVVGVLSPSFTPYPPSDIWIPLQADPNSTDQAHIISVAGRLPAGMTLTQGNSYMAVIGKHYVESHLGQLGNDDNIKVTRIEDQVIGDARRALLILVSAVGLVLLIACANVANLLLARATIRQKEIAIRLAIGATRSQIIRHLLVESVLLAAVGGVLGLFAGSFGIRALIAFAPVEIPRVQEMAFMPALDPWIAGFTLLLSVVTGITFGLFPALRLSGANLASSLQQSGGRGGTSFKADRTRMGLTTAEVAIAVVLLCGALLLIRSFVALHNVSLGFDPGRILTMEVSLAGSRYAKSADVDLFQRQFIDRVEQIPGVEMAAMASALPLSDRMDMIFNIPGRAPAEGHKFTGDVMWLFVSTHYFDVLRIPLISGTLFDRRAAARRTVVINQTMAHKFWPNANPVGQAIHIGPGLGPHDQGMVEIVGIVGDVRERLDLDPPPIMYQTTIQIPDSAMDLVNRMQPNGVLVRTAPGVLPTSASAAVEQALLAIDQLPANKSRSLEQLTVDSTARQKFNLLLLGLFAAFALLLAAVGIYGVMSCAVAQRTHEIGIRTALGANRRDILWLVMSHALRLTIIGAAIGIATSAWLTQFMRLELFGVSPVDPFTFGVAPLSLVAIAILAAFVPALRASRVDPLVALRRE
jgi:putative ABC transport system permease protein